MKILILFLSLSLFCSFAGAQNDEEVVASFFDEALTNQTAFENLRYLTKNIGGRITGSPEAERAVEFSYKVMNEMDLDSVFKQPVRVPKWIRGEQELAVIQSVNYPGIEVPAVALGMSVGTGKNGLSSTVIEVHNFEELKHFGKENISGKIVFYNRPMDATMINTFGAYGKVVNQRTTGAAKAAEFGAMGVVVRSLTTSQDDFPHAGVIKYNEDFPKIPAVAISTNGANLLSERLKKDVDLDLCFKTTCKIVKEVTSHNVIGEIKGTQYPDEIITIGGHLDSWTPGEGAHDDGAGCMQSIEVLRLFKVLGIQPKRTIRAVMFMDEEVAQSGGKEYALQAKLKNEKHYFALEADRGAFMPRGFGVSAPEERLKKILALKKYFKPYGITEFKKGGGGVDIGPLRDFGTPLSSFIPEMQRYFDVHHSGNDTFEKVHFREFQMGGAAIAAFIYLIDKYDL